MKVVLDNLPPVTKRIRDVICWWMVKGESDWVARAIDGGQMHN